MAFEIFKLVGSIFVDSEEANKSIQKTDKSAESLGSKFVKGIGTAAKWGAGIVTAAGAAAVAVGGALIAVTENTRDYRTEMGKLETAYTVAGHSAQAAQNTYRSLESILGETDTAVEASNHLAKLCTTEDELAYWTDICAGVYATFGDSLPIEGLTEAANETAKVGQVTGPLADALNWAGVSEDTFNESLASCTSEQERQALITETLNGLYADAATKYRETNAEIIKSNEAQEKMNSAMAKLGAMVEPIVTEVKSRIGDLILTLIPFAETVANTVLPPLMNMVETILPVIITLFGQIIQAVQAAGEYLQTTFSQISESIGLTGITFGDVMNGIQTAFQIACNVIFEIWNTVGVPLFEFIQQIIGTVAEYFAEKMPEISGFFLAMVSDIGRFWENNLKPCFDAIGKFINNVLAPAFKFVFNTLIVPCIDAAFKAIKNLWENTLKPIFTGITDFLTGVFTGNWKQAFEGLSNIVKGVFEGMINLVKIPLNTIIGFINKFIEGINRIKIPDEVPIIGGLSVDIPKIPLLAKGGRIVERGNAIVGEQGPEMLDLPVGAKVTPLTNADRAGIENDTLVKLLEEVRVLRESLETIIMVIMGDRTVELNDREIARIVREYA